MRKSSWPAKKIEDLFEVKLGKMLNEKAKQGELFPYLANFNVRWGSFDLSRLNEMTFSEKERKKFSLNPGDLLMCEGGEIGRCAIWKGIKRGIFFQKALHRLRPLDSNIKSEFIYYYMEHIASRGELPKLVGETSIAHLTREKLLSLRVPTPPVKEQFAIVNLLSTWDAAIEKTELLITVKEKQIIWLVDNLISYDCAKKTWTQRTLGCLTRIVKGQQLNADQLTETGKYYALNGGIEPSGYTNNWNTPENIISISEGGNSCGYVNFNLEKFWSGGHCYALLDVNELIDTEFLYYYLKSKESRIMILRVGSGLPNIQKKDLEHFLISFPDLPSQRKITKTLGFAYLEIELLRKKAEAYREQKRSLMQKLLTGKWRVKNSRKVA